LDGKELEIEVNRIHEAWIWHKLNISYSIVMEGLDTPIDDATCGIKDDDKQSHQ